MDAIVIAHAIVIAVTVGATWSLVQERFLGKRLEGDEALIANVLGSAAIGVFAVWQSGGFVPVHALGGIYDVVLSILASATLVAVGAKAAFEVLTKPVANA